MVGDFGVVDHEVQVVFQDLPELIRILSNTGQVMQWSSQSTQTQEIFSTGNNVGTGYVVRVDDNDSQFANEQILVQGLNLTNPIPTVEPALVNNNTTNDYFIDVVINP